MTTKKFKYTNYERGFRFVEGLLVLIFFAAAAFLFSNFESVWDSHPVEMIFITLMSAGMLFSVFGGAKQQRENAEVSATHLRIGSDEYALADLHLDLFSSEGTDIAHLYNKDRTFTLYSSEASTDDLVTYLLTLGLDGGKFHATQAKVDAERGEITINTDCGKALLFDLDNGYYSAKAPDEEEGKSYSPEKFICYPEYRAD